MMVETDLSRKKEQRTSTTLVIVFTVVLLILCQGQQLIAYSGISLFLPLIRQDVHLSFAQGGILAAVSTLVYAFMQIPSGYLADRFGARGLFLAGLCGTSFLSLSFALLPTYGLLVLNQAISGFFRALMFAPGLLLITDLFSPERRAMAMGLYVSGGSSSNVLLSLLGPIFVSSLGWRLLFVLFSLVGFLLLLGYWLISPRIPRQSYGSSLPLGSMFSLFRSREMWLVGTIQYVRLAVANGLQFWLPTFIVVEKGYSLAVAGLVIALGAAMTAPANFLGGYLSDRLRNPLLIIGLSLIILAVTTFILVQVSNLVLLLVVIGINGIFVQLYFGPLFNIPIQLLGSQTAGLANGFGNFFANLGGLTFAYILGALKDSTGSFDMGLYALVGFCLLAFICTVMLARVIQRSGGKVV